MHYEAAHSDSPPAEPRDWEATPSAAPRGLPRRLDILLAGGSDREHVRELLEGRFPEAAVREAAVVAEAASLARRSGPDVLVVTGEMPDGGARDLLLRLTVARGTILCPAVIIAEAWEDHLVQPLLRLGAGDYIMRADLFGDPVRAGAVLERAVRHAREQHRLSRRAALYRANTLIKRRRERAALEEAEIARVEAELARDEADAQRREAERARERLDLAVAGAELGTWDWYPASGRVLHNDRLLTMLGYEPDELSFTYTLWRQLLHPEDVAQTVAALGEHLEGRSEQYRVEYRLRMKEGQWKWVLVSGRVVSRDELGRPTRVAGVHLDIDDRKRAELGLIEAKNHAEAAQQQLVDMVTSIRDAFLLLDSQWRYTYVNPRAEELLGKPSSELIGKVIWEVWPELEQSDFGPALRAAMERREMAEVTAQYDPLDKWFDVRVYPAEEGSISLFFIDVTAAREAERAVRESERRNRLLAEAARQLGSSLEPHAIYTRLREIVCQSMSCSGVAVSSFDAAEGMIHCAYAWVAGNELNPGDLPPLKYNPESEGMQTQVIKSGKPMIFGDVRRRVKDPKGTYYEVDSRGQSRNLCQGDPPATQSAVMAPLLSEGNVVGVVQVMTSEPAAYSQADLDLLEGITLQLGVALENARLYLRAQEEIQERRRAEEALREGAERARFLSDATKVLTSSLNPTRAFSRLAELAVPALGDFCFFDIVTEAGDIQRAAWAHVDGGRQKEFRSILGTAPPGDARNHPVSAVIATCRPQFDPRIDEIWMQRSATSPEQAKLMRELGFHSLVCVPLVFGERALGAMTFGFDVSRERRHTPADLELAQELARRAAIAVRNAALYQQALDRESALREAKEHAEAARVSAERAKEIAEEANRAKSEFLAVLSHELRTPLTPVLAGVQMLQQELEEAEVAARDDGDGALTETLAMIRRNVELEVRLIDDLLDLTRITRGKLQLSRKRVDLDASVRHVVEICRTELEEKGLTLSLQLEAQSAGVFADPARLQQVLWNLVKNAIKFTPRGGRILVRTAFQPPAQGRAQGTVICEVRDTGVGISPEILPGIFNAFEQGGEKITRTFGGLGLGLAISRALIIAHGGTIRAHSEGRGRGSSFTIGLPASSLADTSGEPADEPSPPPAAGSRVLLIEDHADTSRLMSRFLERRLGVKVMCAGSVQEGVDLFKREAAARGIDLIISDIGLPDGTGNDLLRRISSAAGHVADSADTVVAAQQGMVPPAIALSGYGTEQDIKSSRDAGFREHITKPVDLDRLEKTVRQMLR